MIECWQCKEPMSLSERVDCDGCCPGCGADVDLEDYLFKALAEVERLRGAVLLSQQNHFAEVGQLRREMKIGAEALRKDAERYRWLKDQGHFRAMSMDMGGNHSWTGMGRHVGKGPTVDDALDAAMAAKEGS